MEHEITEGIDEVWGAKLARYVAGRSTAAEAEEVRRWAAGAAERAELLASLERTWEWAQGAWGAWGVDAAWEELRQRIGAGAAGAASAGTVRAGSVQSGAARPGAWRSGAVRAGGVQARPRGVRAGERWGGGAWGAWAVRAAAVLVLVAGGAALWWKVRLAPGPSGGVAVREYATGRAQRAEVRLPDGTRVVLSVESRLRVPEEYGRRERAVELEGEALFEVEHEESRPFRVRVGEVVAEDLGTVFGVRGYGDGGAVRVVVAEGAVEVKAGAASPAGRGAAYRVGAGELARVGVGGEVRVESGVDVGEYLAFAEGRLVFRSAPLGEVAAQLGRWYDLEVRLAEPALAALPLTATFGQEPLSQVLDLVALSLELRYTRTGRVVTFLR